MKIIKILLLLMLISVVNICFGATSPTVSVDSVTRNTSPTNANYRATSLTLNGTAPWIGIYGDGASYHFTNSMPTNSLTEDFTMIISPDASFSGFLFYTLPATKVMKPRVAVPSDFYSYITNVWQIDVSGDETTVLTTGTAKKTFRAPFAMTITDIRASLTTSSSSGTITITINEAGNSIFSTTLTIDVLELTSTTAATPFVLSDSSIADDAQITIDVNTAGTDTTGLKLKFYYLRQ